MIIMDVEQGSEEWYRLRAGKPSASGFDRILTSKGVISKQREKYLFQLAGETITGQKEDTYQSHAMTVGIEREAEARALYEMLYDVDVKQVGLCYLDEAMDIAASPDGMIGSDGLLEIKAPNLATHVEYLLKGKLPITYFQQVQGQLFVAGYKYTDFMSYFPGMPPFIVRVERDEEWIGKLHDALKDFVVELKEVVGKIKGDN